MGMDILVCNLCDEGFSDYSDYGFCATCVETLCGDCKKEMIRKYGYVDKASDFANNYGDDNPKTCDICTGEVIEESSFLNFVIKKTGLKRSDLELQFRESIKKR